MDAETIAKGLDRPKKTGDGWIACCPAHDDRTPSLSIADGEKGVVVKCFAGCSQADVIDALKSRGLWPTPTRTNGKARRTIAAEYDYASEDGELLYQVLRYESKDFRQRRPDGSGWAWNLKGVTRVPYRLPELLNSTKGIIVCEGEKDADALAALGVTATTCAGGAEKWQASYNQYAAGRTVFILPDNDEQGRKHAQNVAQHLHGTAKNGHVSNCQTYPTRRRQRLAGAEPEPNSLNCAQHRLYGSQHQHQRPNRSLNPNLNRTRWARLAPTASGACCLQTARATSWRESTMR